MAQMDMNLQLHVLPAAAIAGRRHQPADTGKAAQVEQNYPMSETRNL